MGSFVLPSLKELTPTALAQARHHGLPLLLLTAVLVVIYWPVLPLNLIATHTHYGDAMINCYLINWFQHSLWSQPFSAFDAPIFYPQETAGAFSSINLFLAGLTGPLQLLGNPMLSYNLVMYLAVWLSGVSMYGSTFALFQNRKASVVAGVLFSCNSDMIWHFLGHPNVVSPIFIPPLVLLAIRYFQEPRWQYAPVFCLLLYGQFLCDFYLGFIALIGLTPVMLIVFAWQGKRHAKPLLILLGLGVVTLFFVYLLTGPYREVNARVGSGRSIAEMISNSAELKYGYFTPAFHEKRNESFFGSLLGKNTPPNREVNNQYYGWSVYGAVVLHLLIMAGMSLWQRRVLLPGFVVLLLILMLMGFVFSFGPYFWWGNTMSNVKLPMYYVYEYISPLRFMRDTSRFAVLVVTALGFLLALAISQWNAVNLKPAWLRGGFLAGALLVLTVEFRPIASPDFAFIDTRPRQLLARHPEFTRVGSIPTTFGLFLIQSTATFPQTPSGYAGGIVNHHYQQLEPVASEFASPASTALHGALGVQAILVQGAEALALARTKPELEELDADPNLPFALFKLNPEKIAPQDLASAKEFLAGLTEFPPFDVVADADLVKSPNSFPIELGGKVEIKYESISLEENAGEVPIYSIPVRRTNALMVRMSLTSLGVDYVPAIVYYQTDLEPFYSEEKSIIANLPPDGAMHWVKFNFQPQHNRFGAHFITGIRIQFSANPYPGQVATVESVFMDLSD